MIFYRKGDKYEKIKLKYKLILSLLQCVYCKRSFFFVHHLFQNEEILNGNVSRGHRGETDHICDWILMHNHPHFLIKIRNLINVDNPLNSRHQKKLPNTRKITKQIFRMRSINMNNSGKVKSCQIDSNDSTDIILTVPDNSEPNPGWIKVYIVNFEHFHIGRTEN